MERMLLVRLDTILSLDPHVAEVADLKVGQTARRTSANSHWVVD